MDWELPEVLNTDKAPTYAGAIAELEVEVEGKCPQDRASGPPRTPDLSG